MNSELWERFLHSTFIFDLEFIGTSSDLNSCYIWEIGAVHFYTGASFSVTIYPDIHPFPAPFSDNFIQVTSSLLKQRKAVSFHEGWTSLLHWVATIVGPNINILWIAHNAFKADKPMLEIDTKRHGIIIPYNWFFFDSLIYCRQSIPKLPSYTLSDLHANLFFKSIPDAHSALPDAIALRNILLFIDNKTLSGPIYPAYATSLQSIKWLGPSSEKHFFKNGIKSLEQLINVLMTNYSTNCVVGNIVPIRIFIEQYFIENLKLNS